MPPGARHIASGQRCTDEKRLGNVPLDHPPPLLQHAGAELQYPEVPAKYSADKHGRPIREACRRAVLAHNLADGHGHAGVFRTAPAPAPWPILRPLTGGLVQGPQPDQRHAERRADPFGRIGRKAVDVDLRGLFQIRGQRTRMHELGKAFRRVQIQHAGVVLEVDILAAGLQHAEEPQRLPQRLRRHQSERQESAQALQRLPERPADIHAPQPPVAIDMPAFLARAGPQRHAEAGRQLVDRLERLVQHRSAGMDGKAINVFARDAAARMVGRFQHRDVYSIFVSAAQRVRRRQT